MKALFKKYSKIIPSVILSLSIITFAFCCLAHRGAVQTIGFFAPQMRDLTGCDESIPEFSSKICEEIGDLFLQGRSGD